MKADVNAKTKALLNGPFDSIYSARPSPIQKGLGVIELPPSANVNKLGLLKKQINQTRASEGTAKNWYDYSARGD